ncbi:hypothetical protein TorRG33x02_242640 [Trema orientale]|uniref:Uncharacterized protein n=1 Tax=Trema orientale TaxID=63057 RepID=A0A2P5DSQ7_TREOI|nr:hypothetical protein TorRG33x02_242640 [Trema orientale]
MAIRVSDFTRPYEIEAVQANVFTRPIAIRVGDFTRLYEIEAVRVNVFTRPMAVRVSDFTRPHEMETVRMNVFTLPSKIDMVVRKNIRYSLLIAWACHSASAWLIH